MKIPLRWLADYVPLTLPVAELAARLTLAGLEIGSFRAYGLPAPDGLRVRQDEPGPVWERDKVFTARLVSVEKHPNADKLKLPVVEYGQGRTQQLVTGAPNITVGMSGQKVIVGLAGTSFWDTHVSPKKLSVLTPKPVRGVPSEGMVMSEAELGLSDEHEGIILLEDDAPVGVPLADFMGDIVLEADVLPNMARCLALVGVAREVAALTGQTVTLPNCTPRADGPAIAGRAHVVIADAALSPRYAAGLIEGVTIGPAPGWMQRRLTYAGMRPINNIVDITNYVMLEWGQPLHAFDYDALVRRAGGKAPTITVRRAVAGEVLVTLDKAERKLTADMLVIADEKGAIALAGVMGGLETEVSGATTNVLLESASFDFLNIRRTIRALDLPSEASQRFSKGVSPDMVPVALGRASELMRLHAGGKVAKGVVDNYPSPRPPRVVELAMGEVRRLLGTDVPIAECARLLQTLEYGVEVQGETIRATVPAFRLDVQEGPADLVEDIARLHGYDKLPATLLREEMPEQKGNAQVAFEEALRDRLVTLGMQEVICYSLTTPEAEAPLIPNPSPTGGEGSEAGGEYVKLLNPISSERTVMRRSLLPGVLEAAARNLTHAPAVRLFELGSVFLPRAGQKLPDEPRRLAMVLCGARGGDYWGDAGQGERGHLDFYDLKGVIESLLADLHLGGVTFRPAKEAMLHPGKAAALAAGERPLGVMGELHPKVAEAYGLAGRAVLVGDLDLDALRQARPPRFAYRPTSPYPPAKRDIALVVADDLPAERVEAEIRAAGGALLADVSLFDLYKGDSIPAGTKSLAYALTYQAADRTLSDKDVDKAHKAIEGRLRHVLKAQVRGQD